MFKRSLLTVGVLTSVFLSGVTFAQTLTEKATELGRQAIALENKEDYKAAIKLFTEAQKLDPQSITYPYEIAYSYYSLHNYPQAIAILLALKARKDATAKVFRVLGNCYDMIGDTPKAIETFDAGIAIFPQAGDLYLEAGGVYVNSNQIAKALGYFEAGIKADPSFPSNYYWAAKLYCNSNEKVSGLRYAELFLNLERNSERTAEISKLLFDTYKEGVTLSAGNKATVNFNDQNTVNVLKGAKVTYARLPFAFAYESALSMSFDGIDDFDLNTLCVARRAFLLNYHKLKLDVKYPDALFAYQDKVLKAGHFSAYNYWVLMHGDNALFNAWEQEHRDEWNSFLHWFNAHPIKLT